MTKARDLGDFISDGTIAETVTADGLNLGDNEKIQLGASQDLQIYHSGTSSVIHDNGVGNLVLRADGLYINNAAGTENMVHAAQNGAVTLYYDNAAKLATSATGATVTGTIAVSDSFNATSGTFTVQSNGTDILNLTSTVMSPQTDGAISLGSSSNGFNNMYLDGSAYVGGNVGAGTSSPQRQIHSVDSNGEVLRLQRDGPFTGSWDVSIGTFTTGDFTIYDNENSQRAITVEKLTGFSGTSAMYIDSSGNVGIGTTSPNAPTAIVANTTTYEGLELITPTGDGSGEFHIGVHQNGSTAGRSIVFKRGGSDGMDTESMRITNDGKLDIKDDGTASAPSVYFQGDSDTGFYRPTANAWALATAGSERLRIGSSGEIGIGGANYGTSGQVLTSGGSGAGPTWTTISAGAPFSGFGS